MDFMKSSIDDINWTYPVFPLKAELRLIFYI